VEIARGRYRTVRTRSSFQGIDPVLMALPITGNGLKIDQEPVPGALERNTRRWSEDDLNITDCLWQYDDAFDRSALRCFLGGGLQRGN
jgi:hypothetical protein